ncbi:MAG: hypothetical protein QF575_03780 [Acidimicrobiales bacterium]|nr:hypothetical protein [Acidimicrobiales bacterium]
MANTTATPVLLRRPAAPTAAAERNIVLDPLPGEGFGSVGCWTDGGETECGIHR